MRNQGSAKSRGEWKKKRPSKIPLEDSDQEWLGAEKMMNTTFYG